MELFKKRYAEYKAWLEIRRQDPAWRETHYKTVFLKLSCQPPGACLRLVMAIVSLIVSVIALLLTR